MLKTILKPNELKEGEKYNRALSKFDVATGALEARNNEVRAARAKVQDIGPDAQPELDIAKKSRDSAQSILNDLKEDLEVATSRYQFAKKEKERTDTANAWNMSANECQIIKKLAVGAEEDILSADQKLQEILSRGVKAHFLAPKTDSEIYNSLLSNEHLTNAFRQHLVKIGWGWATSWPYGTHEIIPFSKRVEDACSWVLKLRGQE